MLKQRHIEIFRAIMLTRSVTGAAVQLRTSQPTASRFLAEMEREIGFKLFARHGNRLLPTSEAIALYEEVVRSFTGMERIARAARGIAEFDADHLRIASIPSLAIGPLAQAVPRFSGLFPAAAVSLDVHAFDEVVARVAGRQCEVGFTAHAVDHAGLHAEPLVQTDAVCVLHRGHRLEDHSQLHARDLRGMSFVSLEGPSRRRIDKVFEDAGVLRNTLIETQTGAIACRLVAQGAGVSVLDPFTADAMAHAGLVIRPFRPRISFNFNVVMRSGEDCPRIVEQFLVVLRQTIKEMLTGKGVDKGSPLSMVNGVSTASVSGTGTRKRRGRVQQGD